MACSDLFSEDILSFVEKFPNVPIATPIIRVINIIITFRILDISPIKYFNVEDNIITNDIHKVSLKWNLKYKIFFNII